MPTSSLIPEGAPAVVRVGTLSKWLAIHRNTIWLWVRSGRLPQPIKLGPRTYRFRTDKVREALDRSDQRAADRGQGVSHA